MQYTPYISSNIPASIALLQIAIAGELTTLAPKSNCSLHVCRHFRSARPRLYPRFAHFGNLCTSCRHINSHYKWER